jgi:HEAT repeat protein
MWKRLAPPKHAGARNLDEAMGATSTDYSHTLARHLARLVWLLLNEASSYDAQIATLRSLIAASREGHVSFSTREWQLLINGEPLPDRFTGAQDLTAQLIGHSIAELVVQQNVSPTDVLVVARVLAQEPVPGDGGRTVESHFRVLGVASISVRAQSLRDSLRPPAPAVRTSREVTLTGERRTGERRPAETPLDTVPYERAGAESLTAAKVRSDDGVVVQQDAEGLYASYNTAPAGRGASAKLFEQLALATSPTDAARHLDALSKLVADAARKDRPEEAAELFHGIVIRESSIEDKAVKRQYTMAIRRIATPGVLKCVADLLVKRRDNHQMYVSIMARAEEAGVQALVESLIAAAAITDRRIYYDALLELRTGVRTLIQMLADPRWYVVRNAVELLGEMRVSEAEGALNRLLEHKDERVRTAAASALAKLTTQPVAKALRPTPRASMMGLLNKISGSHPVAPRGESVDSLIRALDREQNTRTQMAMLNALGQMGTTQAIEKLAEIARADKGIFRSRPTPLRVAAVHALGEVKSPDAMAVLQSLLRDKDKSIRGAASWVMMGRKSG